MCFYFFFLINTQHFNYNASLNSLNFYLTRSTDLGELNVAVGKLGVLAGREKTGNTLSHHKFFYIGPLNAYK